MNNLKNDNIKDLLKQYSDLIKEKQEIQAAIDKIQRELDKMEAEGYTERIVLPAEMEVSSILL